MTVEDGSLSDGDAIEVVYGDMSRGGRGFTPPLYAGSSELVQAGVNPTGEGEFALLPDENLPMLSHTPGPAVELLLVLPTVGAVGERAAVRLVALDQYQNGVPLPGASVRLIVEEGEAEIEPAAVRLGGEHTLGAAYANLTPTAPGILRVRGTSDDGVLYARSNACVVHENVPSERIYWGDLHSHSHYSNDGTGTGDDHFRYAKYGSLLDVYSASDHSSRHALRPELWRHNLHDTESWYEPGAFVTLFGFEASYDWPVGHHNVYYAHPEGDFWQIEDMDIRDAWKRGAPGAMLTIPHHTGATMSGPPGVHQDRLEHPRRAVPNDRRDLFVARPQRRVGAQPPAVVRHRRFHVAGRSGPGQLPAGRLADGAEDGCHRLIRQSHVAAGQGGIRHHGRMDAGANSGRGL